MGKNKKNSVTKEEMLRNSPAVKAKTNIKQPLEKRAPGAVTGKEDHTLTPIDDGDDQGSLTTVYSEHEDDWWSSDDEAPETGENLAQDRHLSSKTSTNKGREKVSKSTLEENKETQSQPNSAQEKTDRKDHEKHKDEGIDQDSTKETSRAKQLLKKLMKVDKSFMKALLALAAGDQQKEKLIDRIMTEFSRTKNLALEATHEVARLEGARDKEQKATTTVASYADAVKGRTSTTTEGNQISHLSQTQKDENEKQRAKFALLVTSETLNTAEVQAAIKKRIDPQELGLSDPEMREGKRGMVVSTSSKEGLKNLENLMENDPELRARMKTQRPKSKKPELKIIGIDEELTSEEIIRKLISQNRLTCTEEDIKIVTTWQGKEGKTVIVSLEYRAWRQLQGKEQLNIGWNRCRVFDNTYVPRCTFCAKYGHTQKWCRSQTPRCTECSGRHHYKECRIEDYLCSACKQDGWEPEMVSHSMMSRACPTYKARREQELDRILRQLELTAL